MSRLQGVEYVGAPVTDDGGIYAYVGEIDWNSTIGMRTWRSFGNVKKQIRWVDREMGLMRSRFIDTYVFLRQMPGNFVKIWIHVTDINQTKVPNEQLWVCIHTDNQPIFLEYVKYMSGEYDNLLRNLN